MTGWKSDMTSLKPVVAIKTLANPTADRLEIDKADRESFVEIKGVTKNDRKPVVAVGNLRI